MVHCLEPDLKHLKNLLLKLFLLFVQLYQLFVMLILFHLKHCNHSAARINLEKYIIGEYYISKYKHEKLLYHKFTYILNHFFNVKNKSIIIVVVLSILPLKYQH